MPTIQRTFTIPDDISHKLDNLIKGQERSKFVTHSLAKALKDASREQLIKAIDNVDTWEPNKISVVDTIREIRESHAKNLSSHS